MGFLNEAKKEGITDAQTAIKQRKWEEWADKYPFCAVMISDISYEKKLNIAEEMFPRNA